MRHLKPINRKAEMVEDTLQQDVVALQGPGAPPGPHIPLAQCHGCRPGDEPGAGAQDVGLTHLSADESSAGTGRRRGCSPRP